MSAFKANKVGDKNERPVRRVEKRSSVRNVLVLEDLFM